MARIVAIGPDRDVGVRADAPRTIDARGGVVHPGFVDVHVHAMSASRGAYPDTAPLPDGMGVNRRWWAAAEDEDEHASTLLVAAEMLSNGTTCFLEAGTAHAPDAVAEAMRAVGEVNAYVSRTEPFKLKGDEDRVNITYEDLPDVVVEADVKLDLGASGSFLAASQGAAGAGRGGGEPVALALPGVGGEGDQGAGGVEGGPGEVVAAEVAGLPDGLVAEMSVFGAPDVGLRVQVRGRRLVGELRPRDNPAAAALNLRMQEARAERARASAEGTAQAVERAKQYAKAHPSGEEPQ